MLEFKLPGNISEPKVTGNQFDTYCRQNLK